MYNLWQQLWNNRKINFDKLTAEDESELILELKRIVGYDFKNTIISFEDIKKEYDHLKADLLSDRILSYGEEGVFEVGCGSGANLYFFRKDGFKVGGLDYAENLLAVAKEVIGEKNFIECIVGEAIDLPIEIKYDAVFSIGVFYYFPDLNYAQKVLDRMVAKARFSIGIRVLNAETKEDYLKYRREHVKNYDELYKNLPKLFISKDFFREYAMKNNLLIKFTKSHGVSWNQPFAFDCFLYKKI